MCGAEQTSEYMQMLNDKGYYQISDKLKSDINQHFVGYFTNEEKTSTTIKKYFEKYNYLMDTHTAVAFNSLDGYRNDSNDATKTIVASTASPYKFANNVYISLFGENNFDETKIIDELSNQTETKIPLPLIQLNEKSVNFNGVTTPQKMLSEVLNFIDK